MGKYASKSRAYGDAEGPFGFPMPSAVAREVERIWKRLPTACREMGFTRMAEPAVTVEVSADERTDVSLVTTDAVDRDREVVLPDGGDWRQFEKNPVVTFAHRYDELPVGRALWIKRHRDASHNGWLAKTHYTDRPEGWEGQWFPDALWHFVKSGDLPGKSIGFLPLEVSAPSAEEVSSRPDLKGVRRLIRRWLALEYAVAPVQSNPEALVIEAKYAVAPGSTKGDGAVTPAAVRAAAAGMDIGEMVRSEFARLRGRV